MIKNKEVPMRVVDFCLQSECEGYITYTACKQIYALMKDYDDDVRYGYAGRKDCAMFADFKAILADSVENKCRMVWS